MTLNFGKFKILCVNIFLILLKATTLNPYELQKQLKEVEYTLQADCDLCHRFLVIIISLYLEIKFVVGYITLAANVIAVFPILADDLPHLLLPALFAQTIDHIVLNVIEIILALCTTKIMAFENISIFCILVMSKIMHITFAISALNIYSDYYQQLNFMTPQWKLNRKTLLTRTQEKFLRSQCLE